MIKNISFDLWGTLIKQNPQYSIQRLEYLESISKKSKQEITGVLSQVKSSFNNIIETHGVQFDSLLLHRIIVEKLELPVSAGTLCDELTEMFLKYPPMLYDENTYETLRTLSENYKLYLLSNTLLIEGKTLRKVMEELDIHKFFYCRIFSNEMNMSKPNPMLFFALHNRMSCLKEEVVHIGDSYKCDVLGATKYGFNAIEINTDASKKTIIDVQLNLTKFL